MTNRNISKTLSILILLVIIIKIIFLTPFPSPITGLLVYDSNSITEDLDQSFTSSTIFEWTPKNNGLLKDLRISGISDPQGTAKIYLTINNSEYLVFTNEKLNQNSSIAYESDPINSSNKIPINLEYNSDSEFDIDNDGIEPTNGIIDFRINSDEYKNKSNYCTQWEVYSLEQQQKTQLCYGSLNCCSLISLPPSRESWNETFYLSYNQYGSTINNIVSSRLLYANFTNSSLDYLAVSDWYSLKASFISKQFENQCGEICDISNLNKSKYIFRIELTNSTLNLTTISYNVQYLTNTKTLKLKNKIPDQKKEGLEQFSILLSDYLESQNQINYDYFKNERIDIEFENNLAIIRPKKYGVAFTYIEANDSNNFILSNVFSINITQPIISETSEPIQQQARLNQPVKWIKKIIPLESNLEIILTSDASNIAIFDPSNKKSLDQSKIKINQDNKVNTLKEFNKDKTKKSKGTTSIKNNITLILEGHNLTKEKILDLEYFTSASTSEEIQISSSNKKITISSETPYENIIAYTTIPNYPMNSINLFWIINNSKIKIPKNEINFIDNNQDLLIDQIEWVVPNLLNPTYELELEVLNIHSYPTLFGNWTVEFNTTGTGNLTISSFSSTSYSEMYLDNNETKDDLEILEVKCGNDILFNKYDNINNEFLQLKNNNNGNLKLSDTLNETIRINSIYIENYNCPTTAYHTVKTLTTGAHYQQFNFSGQIAQAFNTVAGEVCDEGNNITLCVINTVKDVTNGSILDFENLTIQSGGALRNQTPGTFFTINASNIIIEDGGFIQGNVNITTANLTIHSGGVINSSSLGYIGGTSGDNSVNSGGNGVGPGAGQIGDGTGGGQGGGGAGYGSTGGAGFGSTSNSIGGSTYGNPTRPTDYGSGGAGGDCSNSPGGIGGGLIFINATGILNISGNITSEGGSTADTVCGEEGAYSGGAGSGGSILLISSFLTGNGSIYATGGYAGGNLSNGGGGSGGRIAVYAKNTTFTGITQSNKGFGFRNGSIGSNFSTQNLSITINLSQYFVDPTLNLTIFGRMTPYGQDINVSNTTIEIFVDDVKQYYNVTSGILVNSSSEEDTNETTTDIDGVFNYNISAPSTIRNYSLTINSTLFVTFGESNITFNVSTSIPEINGTVNNTSPKINDIINVSLNMSDTEAISSANISFNVSGGSLYSFLFNLEGTSSSISQNISINLSRGNVINITGFVVDTAGNLKQNSTIVEVANTAPTTPSIINTTGKFYNINQTINWTSTDSDNELLNFTVRFYPCKSRKKYNDTFFYTTDYNLTTNMTKDSIYCLNITVSDTIEFINMSSAWNITLDRALPKLNITVNNTSPKFNEIINITSRTIEGNALFSSINITVNISGDPPILFNQTPTDIFLENQFDIAIRSSISGEDFGISVASAGDVNGDGFDDVIVGAYNNDVFDTNAGAAYIIFGGTTMDTNIDISFNGTTASDNFGFKVASAGDVNGDGFDDVMVGAYNNDDGGPSSGAAYIYFGNTSMDTDIDINISGVAEDKLGISLAPLGDLNKDGYDDIAVSAYQNNDTGENAGAVYIFYGNESMDNQFDVNLTGIAAGDAFGSTVSSAGDVNGDGYTDIIVGSPFNDDIGSNFGASYIFFGNDTMDTTFDVNLTASKGNLGKVSSAGDVNGDGYDDVIVGASLNSNVGTFAGASYVWFGNSTMDNQLDINLTHNHVLAGDRYGTAQAALGDLNGDGYDDIIVGASWSDTYGGSTGSAYIFYGNETMNVTENIGVNLTGTDSGQRFGQDVASAGDVNGDGFNDVIVGAHSNDEVISNAGAVFIYLWGRSYIYQNITTNLTKNNVLNITGLAIDPAGNLQQHSVLVTMDDTPPTVPTIINTSGQSYGSNQTINWTSNDVDNDQFNFTVYFSKQCPPSSDELFSTSDLNFTTNMTSDGTYCLNLTVNDSIVLINSTTLWNISLDTTSPNINGTINNTAPKINEIINASFNISDATGLSSANISINISGNPAQTFLFDISGTSDKASQNITINLTRGNVINITGFAVDLENNIKQNSTLLTIATTPPLPATISNQSGILFLSNQTISWVASDVDNDDLNFTVYFSKQCPPSSDEFITTLDSNFTTNMSDEGIHCLNISVSDGEAITNSTSLWNISINTSSDTTSPIIDIILNGTSPQRLDVLNISLNLTDERALNSANISINLSGPKAQNFQFNLSGTLTLISQNVTINHSRNSVLNISGFVYDEAGNSQQDSTVLTVNNSLPILSITNLSGKFYSKNQTINWTVVDNDKDNLNFTVYFSKQCPPNSNETFSTTDHNFTTNMTSQGLYCLNVTSYDGLTYYNLSLSWNITLDSIYPSMNLTINNSAPRRYEIINISMNFSDDRSLTTTNITHNSTGTLESFNFSVGVFKTERYPKFNLTGKTAEDYFGLTVESAGDFDGDGYDDFIVGAPLNDDGGSKSGSAYLYLRNNSIDNTLVELNLTSAAAGDQFGRSVSSAGDVNGDGYGDIIVGAYLNGGSDTGAAYIYLGSSTPDTTSDITLSGLNTFDYFGISVSSAGDINADGFDDVIVGAYGNDDIDSGAGAAYVFYGGTSMDNTADITLTDSGAGSNDQFGRSVSSAGDINADGFEDVIVGAPQNGDGGTNAGQAHVFLGASTMDSTPDITLTGTVNSKLGFSVADAGDINADGFDDVIVGAYLWGFGSNSLGSAYILLGNSTVDNGIDINLTGTSTGGSFGYSVASAGDFNGDGYGDVIIGALTTIDMFGNALSQEGAAYLFLGGDEMDNTFDLNISGFAEGDALGSSVSLVGDINYDGFSDLIIGSEQKSDAGDQSGSAFIYLGGGQDDLSSQNITINVTRNNVINITGLVLDESNNINQTSKLITIQDTIAFNFSIGENKTLPLRNDIINISVNVSDYDELALGFIEHNITGNKVNFSFNLSGETSEFSKSFTINLSARNVINFTAYVNDTVGIPLYQNSLLINVTNTLTNPPTIVFPSNGSETKQTPMTINITFPEDPDKDTLTAYYYINNILNQTSTGNLTFNMTEGNYNLSISLYDGTDFTENTTTNFTYDITAPTITINNKDRTTNLRHIIINGTLNETRTVQNVTIEMNSTYIANASYDNNTNVFNVTVNLTEGWNRYSVYAYDKAGNFRNVTSSEQGASVLSDTTIPIVRLITAPNGSTLANGSLISFEISDKALTSASYMINNQSFRSFNFIYDIDVLTPDWVEGTNYLIVNASDNVGISTIKNYTFGFSTDYEVFLNVSINYMNSIINDTNSTKNDLQDETQLNTLLGDSSAEISLINFNGTLNTLGLVNNLSNSVSSLQSLLSNIININSSDETNITKTENISIEILNSKVVRNNTYDTVRVSLYDRNIDSTATSTIKTNVSNEISNSQSLSSSEQTSFESATTTLQSKTNITNIGTVMDVIYVSGRETNLTLIEKQVNITESSTFYFNEFIDKNITGTNDLNATDIINEADSGTYSVLVEDPIIRWSFTSSKSAVIKYTIPKTIDSDNIKKANTVITSIPSITGSSTSDSTSSSSTSDSSSSGGGGGAVASVSTSQSPNVIGSSTATIESISPDKPATILINNDKVEIRQIQIESSTQLENVEISVSSLKEAPPETKSSPPSSTVHRYLSIDNKNIKSEDIKKAKLEYKVPKSWLNKNRLTKDDIALYRLTYQWEQLPTRFVKEEGNNIILESLSEGFSIFAIAEKVDKAIFLSSNTINKTINLGESGEIALNITNLVDFPITVNVELEDLDTDLNTKIFTLDFGEKQTISLNLFPQEVGILTGKLIISSIYHPFQETKEVPILIKTIIPEIPYKLNVTIPQTKIEAGSELDAIINIISKEEFTPFNTELNYIIKDEENNIVFSSKESRFIDSKSFNKTFEIPDIIPKGKYIFIVELKYTDGEDSSATVFNIIRKKIPYPEVLRILIIDGIVLMLIFILSSVGFAFYKSLEPEIEGEITLSLDLLIQNKNRITRGGILETDIKLSQKRSNDKIKTIKPILEVYFLTSEKKLIYQKNYNLILKKWVKLSRRFSVPSTLPLGNYILVAKLIYKDQTKSTGEWFTIKNDFSSEKRI